MYKASCFTGAPLLLTLRIIPSRPEVAVKRAVPYRLAHVDVDVYANCSAMSSIDASLLGLNLPEEKSDFDQIEPA